MTVAYKLVRETFTSRVTLDRPNLKILVEYLEGPFRRLNNRWNFRPPANGACDVEFFIAYEFRSRTLGMLMGAMFDAAFRRFAAAFERRADEVYGSSRRNAHCGDAISSESVTLSWLTRHRPARRSRVRHGQ